MKFLIDANLPRPLAELIRQSGHEAVDVRDVGLRAARDQQIADYAKSNKLCLLTSDFDFADIRIYPPENYAGIVVLVLPEDANRELIMTRVRSFLQNTNVLDLLNGRLAIVESWRVRLRPA